MSYKYYTHINSPNYTPEESCLAVFGVRRIVRSITVHHWGDPSNFPQAPGVVNWLINPNSGVSAHYVATAGSVWSLVDDKDVAWHAGSARGNATSIGVELNPQARPADYTTASQLIRDLRRFYGPLPLLPHNHWTATACPGRWDLARLDRMSR